MREAMRATKLFVIDDTLDPELGVTRFVAEWQESRGTPPSFLFRRVLGHDMPVVMNLLSRQSMFRAFGIESEDVAELAERIARGRGEVVTSESMATRVLDGLHRLPILKHQPRDAGRYLTSFVGVLQNPENGITNLGFYRVLVTGERSGIVFMDPRTDAHRIVAQHHDQGESAKITLFCGGSLATYLAGAWGSPPDADSYQLSSAIAAREIAIDRAGDYPAAPCDAEVVIHGSVLRERRREAPFGEFKGYYCATTESPVLQIDEVRVRPDAYYYALFCGKEDGLTLMALQNEVRMLSALRAGGFPVRNVRYPLGAFGEFLALVEAEEPTRELLEAAMALDHRTKAFLVGKRVDQALAEGAIFDCEVISDEYVKRGAARGRRVGIVVGDGPAVDRVEW